MAIISFIERIYCSWEVIEVGRKTNFNGQRGVRTGSVVWMGKCPRRLKTWGSPMKETPKLAVSVRGQKSPSWAPKLQVATKVITGKYGDD
jgi:hypothetical protein